MNLITTYYTPSNTERLNEINLCLQKNVENKYIKKIILLNNEIFPLNFLNDPFKKITQVKISNNESYKLKFSDAIKYINEYCKDEICILANSDIYFNETLNKINRFKSSFGIDGPIHDAIICEFPTIESDREITEFDFMKFYFFKPNFSQRFNLNKLKNREIFIKIKLSLMEIFINGFIKNKIECPKYDPTQIKLITGGKRSRKVKKQRKSKKRKSRSRK